MKIINKTLLAISVASLVFASAAAAESVWVSDQFEITLRSGPSTSNSIDRMLKSGAELEALERDAETGYTRVRTQGGTEGWVLSRYLMNEASAREQLAKLSGQLSNAATQGSSLNSQLVTIKNEYDTASRTIATLEQRNKSLDQELAEIKRTSANVLSINDQNKGLREQLAAAEIRVATLEQQNRELTSQTTRYWFMAGAAVLIFGMVLGLWLPRIRWQRGGRSRYDRL